MSGIFNNLGLTEWIVIGLILVVFFGSKKISDLGKTAGEATREFKKIKKQISSAAEEVKSDIEDEIDE